MTAVRRWWRVLVVVCATTVLASAAFADVVTPIPEIVTRVIVRARATTDSPDVGGLRLGDRAELLESLPDWYRVRLGNGVEGFVSKRWTVAITISAEAPPSFTVDVVDVGTGLAILVRGPDFTLVYDGGSNDDVARGSHNRLLAFIRQVAPALTSIDHLILSHPHRDHVELLPDLLAAYDVREIWDSGRLNDICGYRAFIDGVRRERGSMYHAATPEGVRAFAFAARTCYGEPLPAEVISVVQATRVARLQRVRLGEDATMTILYADGSARANVNDNSLVIRLELGASRVLLMGDAEAGGRLPPTSRPAASSLEGQLLQCCASLLAADVLVVGHHGSLTSSRQVFLNAVGASTFLVSAGPTKYGSVTLPDPAVIDELSRRGAVFRTDVTDVTCGSQSSKIGPVEDGEPGGCDNIRVMISEGQRPHTLYWRNVETR